MPRFQEPSDLIVTFVNDGDVIVHEKDNIAVHNFILLYSIVLSLLYVITPYFILFAPFRPLKAVIKIVESLCFLYTSSRITFLYSSWPLPFYLFKIFVCYVLCFLISLFVLRLI